MHIKPQNEIKVAPAENGYILKYSEYVRDADNGERIYEERTEIFAFDDVDERNALKALLERISELLGYTYSKYGRENINITFDKLGHKIYE